MMTFRNVYEDDVRAESYAHLGFPGTYFLAYRDVPAVLQRHAQGRRAVDFGCGTGRSTRFLREHGFDVLGVDISPQMIALARQLAVDLWRWRTGRCTLDELGWIPA